jgi:hypothetical protein
MASFLQCDEGKLCEPQPDSPSRMPFWSRFELFSWHGPKPTWQIRAILKRIRAMARGVEDPAEPMADRGPTGRDDHVQGF